ncbi:hypothetical protein CAEBREN_11834 [Caenorhabditis brenneri]|uniref:Uncharacterized protein n=1 Tax=Caenorhabditis brenneri TaxID=135651 RepID=G0NEG7_CAEBE|nr:hypothetical protein CAEBREN_11834 [Caenorhabditis brenneri]
MLVIAMIVTVLSIFFAIITVIINSELIFSLFISKSLHTHSSLSLFYIRFVVDGLLGLQNAIISGSILLSLLDLGALYNFDPTIFLFYVFWSTMNFFNVRAILVIVITFDRTLAVFLPITYHNFRRKFANSLLSIIPLSYPIVNNIVLWVICKYELNIPSGCVIFTCQMNACYIKYALSFEVISHAIIALSSLLLAMKLFIWNHCKKAPKSKDLERANYLALIDTLIIILFDIVPAGITVKFPNIAAEFGSIILVCKMAGSALEGCLVTRALKRKNDILSSTNGKSSVMFLKTNLIMLFFTFLNLTNMDSILDSYPDVIFYISWPTVNMMNIRAFLIIIITFDRTFAVFFPVFYHNYRNKIGNPLLIFLVLGYSLIENLVLWVVCDFVLHVPIGCINMGCYMNKCFIQYFLGYEMISHSVIFITSLLLSIKIFVWNNCGKSGKSKDLTRANLLALLDTSIIFSFDIIPAALLAKFQNAKFENAGPVLAVTKMSGFVLEGYLVVRALKRKQDMESESNAKSWSTVKVKASNAN